MSDAGKDPPSGRDPEHSDARPGSADTASWRGLIIPPAAAEPSNVIPTPFGLIRMWESLGQTFLAETSPDGALLGPALALSGGAAGARAASAVVHRADADFFLTVAWLQGGTAGQPGDVLLKSWQIGRGPLGLSLTAANDNPLAVGAGASEALVTGLAGDALLLTWVEAGTGTVHGEVRAPHDAAAGGAVLTGQTVSEPTANWRRVQVVEIGPLEFAVLWLAANRRDLAGVTLTRDLAVTEESADAWSSRPMQPVALDAHAASGFSIRPDGTDGAFTLSYETAGDAATAPVRQEIVLLPAARQGEVPGAGALTGDDFGFLWANQDLLHLAPSALHGSQVAAPHHGPLITRGDEPLLIDLAAHGAGAGVKIVSVDGTPLSYDGPTRIANGWFQLRSDGHLTFTPDVDAAGHIRLFLSGLSETGAAWSRHLDVHVEGMFDAAALELRHPVKAIPAHAVIAHHAQMAEIGIRGEAPPHGAVSLSGVDADKFVVIGNGLFLRAGTRLEPGRKALDVAVQFKDGLAGAAIAASLTIAVLNEPGAFLSLALPGRAQAAEISAGQVVAEMGVVDHATGADRISLVLLSNAGGRFALSGGNLVVASPHLFTSEADTTYDIVVRMSQPNGVAIDHKVTLHHEDVLGRLPAPAEKAAAVAPPEKTVPPPSESAQDTLRDAQAAPPAPVAAEDGAPGHVDAIPAVSEHETSGAEALPPLRVEAQGPASKGSSSQPDLGAGAGSPRPQDADGLSKVLAQQQAREDRGSDRSGRDDGVSRHEKDLVEALRALNRGDDDRRDHSERGSDHKGEGAKADAQAAHADISGDTLLFKPGFGKETIEHVKLSGGEPHDVLDLSLYGTTFEALRAAGAFEQVGNDVVLTLNPADPAHSDQIVLKSIDLHQIDPGDFKFS